MAALLVLVFLVVPLVELYLIIQVGSAIGALNTIVLLVVMAAAGGWLVKREGLGVLRRIQSQLQGGRLPGRDLVDAFLILFAGALMLTPGFLTDVVGLALLLPPVRSVVRTTLGHRVSKHLLDRHRGDGRGYLDV